MRDLLSVSRRLLLVCIICCVTGCARPTPPVLPPSLSARGPGEVEDLRVMPQDLNAYLRADTANRPIIPKEQLGVRMEAFRRTWLGPWSQTRPVYTRRQVEEIFLRFTKSPGYGPGGQRNAPEFARSLHASANLRTYPNNLRRAVTLKNTSLRGMPTTRPRFSDPSLPGEGYPFDYLQHTALPPATPLLVTHVSRDGAWYLAESALTFGWLPAADVAFVDETLVGTFFSARLAAVVKEHVAVSGAGITADVGAVFPMSGAAAQDVLVPVRDGSGQARLARASLEADAAVPMPMRMTPRNVAAVGNRFMGQPYGWGGLDGRRDCSALTHDLFVPFGLYLPRNSGSQAAAGGMIPLGDLGGAQKEATILSQGVPFATLLWMKGHIMVYVGQWKGHPAVFHDMWGLRTFSATGRDGRLVIGRAVVTTLRAGEETPAVGPQHILLNRVRSMVILARPY